MATGLALFVERRYAAPLCERYAAERGLVYKGLDYPVIGKSSSTTSPSGRCILLNAAGRRDTVSLTTLEQSTIIALLVSFALQIEVTIPVAFVAIALIWVALANSHPRGGLTGGHLPQGNNNRRKRPPRPWGAGGVGGTGRRLTRVPVFDPTPRPRYHWGSTFSDLSSVGL